MKRYEASRVLISNHVLHLEVKLSTRMDARGRRHYLMALFRAARPVLETLGLESEAHIERMDRPPYRYEEPFGPKIRSLSQALDLTLPEGRTGSEFRARRLHLGLTLGDVAAVAGINPRHLSRVERGEHRANALTEARLLLALAELEAAAAAAAPAALGQVS